jgi:hypothetical protein
MKPNEQFVVIDDPNNEPIFSIEFRKKDIQIVKEAIRSHFGGSIPIKRLQDGCYRISFDSHEHDPETVKRLIQSLPKAL